MKSTLCFCTNRRCFLGLIIVGVTLVCWNFKSCFLDEHKIAWTELVSPRKDSSSHQASLTDESRPWEGGGEETTSPFSYQVDLEQTTGLFPNQLDFSDVIPQLVNMTALKHAVRNQAECLEVAADPRSFWRSQPNINTTFTANLDFDRMFKSLRCGLLYPEYMNTPPVNALYPYEKYYLSEPPLLDTTQLSSNQLSVVTLLTSRTPLRVGETVTIRIDTKDMIGRPKVKGGDEIRVWFKDIKSSASMAAEVTDLNNGTYLATATLLWAGKLSVKVGLAYHREYLRTVVYLHQVIKTFRQITAQFHNSEANETTPCYHTPLVLGYENSELCNLTEINGSPWFCGRPIKSQLSCDDYVGTRVMEALKPLPVTDPELELLQRSCKDPRVRYIPANLQVTVLPGINNTTVFKPTVPCHKFPAKATWTLQAPRGFLLKNKWYPSFCSISQAKQGDCFKHTKIHLLGDSNSRGHYNRFIITAKCVALKKQLIERWHKPLLCANSDNDSTISWEPHANPFISGSEFSELGSLVPTAQAIDRIPAHGRHLIILNHYLHLTTTHTSALEYMYRAIKDALLRLFQRNSKVLVLLQGPHIAWKGWPEHYAAGDMLGPHIMALQREIFKDILDRVVYLSPWDMTIAAVNYDFHATTNKEFSQTILGFMCGRE